MTLRYSTTLRNAQLDQIEAVAGASCLLRFYTGAQPANVATAATGTLLGTLTFGADPFAAASGGSVSANAITQDSSADATGTAGWWRLFKSDGTTAVMDGSCTATGGGGDIELVTTSIVTGQPIQVTSFVISAANA